MRKCYRKYKTTITTTIIIIIIIIIVVTTFITILLIKTKTMSEKIVITNQL